MKRITLLCSIIALTIALCALIGCSSSQTDTAQDSTTDESATSQQPGRVAIELENEVSSVGPYSQVVRAGDMLYCSAQVGQDPATGKIVDGGVGAQTTQIMKNYQDELQQAGSSLDDVVKVTVYIRDMGDFEEMNEAYAAAFTEPYPARACVEVTDIPFEGALVSIEMVAYSPI